MLTPQPVSQELMRLMALVVDEWRRLEAGRSAEQLPRSRPIPPTYRELTKEDLENAKDDDRWPTDYVRRERSDRYKKQAALGRGRCEAGVKMWDPLRCQRSTPPGEQWCTHHRPTPPKPLPGTQRLHPWDLGVRPDGDLIGAVYGRGPP